MKTSFLLFFFIAVFLGSCTSPGNYVTKYTISVFTKDSIVKKYDLLSVRGDSAILVSFYDASDSLHLKLIKKDSISRITRKKEGVSGDYSGIFDHFHGLDIILIPLILPVALLIDAIATREGSPIEISLDSAKDCEFLRSIALYPDKEPDEMQYIK
jgi:hypothetical protein